MKTVSEILTKVIADLAAATTTNDKHLAILDALDSVNKNLCKPGFQPAELLSYLKVEQEKLHEIEGVTQ